MDIYSVIDEDKVRKINREIQDLNRRFETVSDNDKKIQKMLKELDINHLIKLIQEKAYDREFRDEVQRLEDLIGSLSENVQKMF